MESIWAAQYWKKLTLWKFVLLLYITYVICILDDKNNNIWKLEAKVSEQTLMLSWESQNWTLKDWNYILSNILYCTIKMTIQILTVLIFLCFKFPKLWETETLNHELHVGRYGKNTISGFIL